MMLMRLPGDPTKPPLVHSLFMLGTVLTEAGVVDRASSIGETAGLTLSGGEDALISGVTAGGVEAEDEGALLFLLLPPLSTLMLTLPFSLLVLLLVLLVLS